MNKCDQLISSDLRKINKKTSHYFFSFVLQSFFHIPTGISYIFYKPVKMTGQNDYLAMVIGKARDFASVTVNRNRI